MIRHDCMFLSAALATDSNVSDDENLTVFDVELENDLVTNTETMQVDSLYSETIVNQLVVTNLLLALILGCVCACIFSRYIRG